MSTPLEIGRGLGTWFQSLVDGSKGKKKGKQSRGPAARSSARPSSARPSSARKGGAAPLSFGGAFLAVAVLISLGAGFLAGQWTGGAGAQGGAGTLTGQAPGPLNTTNRGASVQLTPAQETQRLGDWVYQLAAYKEAERQKASRLVNWLVGQGLETARMYQQVRAQDQEKFWVVACYSPAPDDREIFEQIKKLSPPAFEPSLARRLGNLKANPRPR
ncbi:MAG: hypothetical protein ACYTG5_01685 [Planctomycetota bacterium]